MILGISLDKVNAERKDMGGGEFKVSYASEVSEFREADVASIDEKVAELIFTFDAKYEQDDKEVGSINFKGSVLWKGDLKDLKERWAADKKLPENMGVSVMNSIYRKCLIMGTGLAEQLGLPSPVPMPRVALKTTNKAK